MSNQIKQIADRIKALREISNLSLENISSDLNVSMETYTGYESGNVDIPIGFLHEFASKFNVELTEILTGTSPKLHYYTLVRNGKGMSVDRKRPYKYQSLAYNFIHKKAEPFLVTVDPEANSDMSLNSHPGQEFNYVIEGTLKIVINNKEIILEEGDSLFFDSNQPHGMQAIGDKKAKFLAIIF